MCRCVEQTLSELKSAREELSLLRGVYDGDEDARGSVPLFSPHGRRRFCAGFAPHLGGVLSK